MIVRTPRPSSPSRWASVPSSSSSLEALDRLPSLSLSRTTSIRLRVPSASTRGTTKQVIPPSAWASTRKTSFIGAEVNHLWPCRVYQPSSAVGSARVWLARTSEPPCFSVIPIPASAPTFSGPRPHARVVGPGREQRRPLLRDRVVGPQRRHGGVRHRDRAAVPRLGLRPREEAGRAPQVGVRVAALLLLPRRRLQAVADRALHQPVPRRVELDLVDAVAEAVVRRQLGVVAVGEHAVLAGLLGAGLGAERGELLDEVGRPVAGDRLGEGDVGRDDVVADQRRRLVGGHAGVGGRRSLMATP